MENTSVLEKIRLNYKPKLPEILKNIASISMEKKKIKKETEKELKTLFPQTFDQPLISLTSGSIEKEEKILKVGVVFSGGQASGGHNVIAGLFDSLKILNEKNSLFGFLNGPTGIIENNSVEITKQIIKNYRNLGGFDLLGSSRTKIESSEDLKKSLNTAKSLDLDGIVVIGGDDSNTNAAILAEYFLKNNFKTRVIGVPKTIDGDLKNEYILTSFGFDTACKVYSEMIGNIEKDALSAKKYYHFIKVMGRSASHIALECALKTHPNYVFIAEEVLNENKTLESLVVELADLICKRKDIGKNYGVIVIPEGIIEFIPEVKVLIKELNSILAKNEEKLELLKNFSEKIKFIQSNLSENSKKVFLFLPEKIQKQLLLKRDPHGNVQVSKIETEQLFIEMVKKELKKRNYSKFNAVAHFFGYEGRASIPSNFDANYCYSLGFVASALIKENLTGYIACVTNLNEDIEKWGGMGINLVSLMNMEERKGKKKPVIKKALVDIKKKYFKRFLEKRKSWGTEDKYKNPGAIQYFGEREITDTYPETFDL
jgi:pyrophosphate--fructose-6-phosphate 1-phosphotransferase